MVYLERTDDGVSRITGNSGEPPHLKAWPVGSIFFGSTSTNPKSLIGGGTWVAHGQGRMPIGCNPSDPDFDSAGKTGGVKKVGLSVAQLPVHDHHAGGYYTVASGTHSHASGTYSTGYDGGHSHDVTRKADVGGSGGFARGNGVDDGSFSTSSGGGHSHSVDGYSADGGTHGHDIDGYSATTGSGEEHENMPPYIVVYMWRRTA